MKSSRLTDPQISQLSLQGCTAHDWNSVQLSSQCDISRFQNVTFIGTVTVENNAGSLVVDGVEARCGIYNATIANCSVGPDVRISNIGSVISNYTIEKKSLIENVASLVAEPGATFGNGVEVDVVNEAGGRGTKIINDLTAQTAYMQAMMRHNQAFTKNLSSLIEKKAAAHYARATVGEHARILHCGPIKNVYVGAYAYIHGAQLLENGTVNSCAKQPTEIGDGVQAKSFIVSEGARIESGALVEKCFVGQAVKMGKQYSAENSLFFANCEGFHGEAVSIFAGPFTVTHHKSTLLIAGMFSFYNAGSGTNQSNHMYKLGPVHQGVFERGCKTGSFSYVLLESHIGAFSVVIGKHFTNIDTPDLPFSYIHEGDGVSKIIPGMNLFSVGTVRDGEKWPKRDNRRAPQKRDLIIFDVFSPYTVEKMRRGRDQLLALSESTPKEKAFVSYGGLQLNRLLLRKGAKYYSMAISRYLNEKVCSHLMDALAASKDWKTATASLKPELKLKKSEEWTDLSGLLTARERVAALELRVADGALSSYDEVLHELQSMYDAYRADEWQYIYETFAKEYSVHLESITKEQAIAAVEEWQTAATSLHSMIIEDSKREFGSSAKIGYGLYESDEDRKQDFLVVRGSSETNSVVQKLVKEGGDIQQRYHQIKDRIPTT